MAGPTYSEGRLLDLLEARHDRAAWALFRHVADATGFGRSRTADAVAMSLWPSRGLELHGFEVKSARSDWLRELKAPAKAEEIGAACHRWWIVAAPDVVGDGELPPAWGLLEARGNKLVQRREAPAREVAAPTWAFVAALLRANAKGHAADLNSHVRRSQIAAEIEQAEQRGYERGVADSGRADRDLKELRDSVALFEAAAGVKIGSRWDSGMIGDAVRLALLRPQSELDAAARRAIRDLEEAAAGLRRRLQSVAEGSPSRTRVPG